MKTIKTIWLLWCLLGIIQLSNAQENDVLLINSQTIEDNAYQDIEGSPYYFKTWVYGTIKNKHAKLAEEEAVLLNYNGYTKNFEVRNNNSFIALDESHYDEVRINGENEEELIFKTGLHPKYPNRFVHQLYENDEYQIIQDFIVTLNTREKEIYAGTKIIKKFLPKSSYYLIKEDSRTQYIKLKKKSLKKLVEKESK